ncbi:MAG: VOC family protein [Mycobacterium sp.]
MLGHLGINLPDLTAAKGYYDAVMPLLGFDERPSAEDEFAHRPAGGKPGTYLFFYPSAEDLPYTRHGTGLQHLAFMMRTRPLVNDVHALATLLIPQFGGQVLHRFATKSVASIDGNR